MTPDSPAVLSLQSVAFWSTRLPDWDTARAVIRGERAPPEAVATRPAPTLLAPTERRRAPDTVALALEVAARACAAAGCSPAELPSVFASTHGDLAISDYMCATLVKTPTLISPIKFHNSVHNAAAGYWSIGTGSYATYTSISAFNYTFGTGLLEAATQALCERKSVLYVAFDIEAKGAMVSVSPSRGMLGTALILSTASDMPSLAQLALSVESAQPLTQACSAAAPLVQDNVLAPCLPFFEALASSSPQSVLLGLNKHLALRVQMNQTR